MSDPIGREPAKVLILLCVSIPAFMLNLDANIVAVSLPAIAHSLKADFAAIEWVVSAYTLTFASLMLPAGMLADRYGRKNITLGPVTGGLITHLFGWEWAFYINVPIGLAMIGLTVYAVRPSRDPDATGVDVPGSFSFAGALFLVTLALISGNCQGWSSPTIAAEIVSAAVLAAVAAIASWLTVRSSDTAPVPNDVSSKVSVACAANG
jgi:MFS family permease